MGEFEQAAEDVKKFTSLSQDTLLKLYGLYKQATVGDNANARPGMFDLKGRAKHDAWVALKGKSQDEAKAEYCKLVASFKK